jgi:hypothetical protein
VRFALDGSGILLEVWNKDMADNDLQIAIGIKAGNAKKKSAHC